MALLDTMKQIRSIADERTMAGPGGRIPMGTDKKQMFREAFMKLDQEFKKNRQRVEEARERNMVAANAMMQHEQREAARQNPQAQPQQQRGSAPQQTPQSRQIRPLING